MSRWRKLRRSVLVVLEHEHGGELPRLADYSPLARADSAGVEQVLLRSRTQDLQTITQLDLSQI